MFEKTRCVVTVKLALVCPADTVTVDGTVATDVLLLERLTLAPPEGAAPVNVTVPVELLPPLTLVGLSVSDASVTDEDAGLMVSVACCELLPSVAVIVAVVVAVTDVVVTVKLVLVDPAAMVTLLGTVALELLLLKLTTEPPEGAAELRVTVPVELFPPVTLVGFNVTEETVVPQEPAALTVRLVDTVAPPDCPYMGATTPEVSQFVPMEKLTLLWPAGTVTVMGSCIVLTAAVLLLLVDIKTSLPPEGAAEAMVTVPVVLFPAVTLLGFTLIPITAIPVVTVTVPCAVLLPRVAVVVTTVLLRTNAFFAAAWKVPVVAPAGTVTLLGTLRTEGLSSLKLTTEPPDGAAALKVTVPVLVPPFGMLAGLNVTDEIVAPHPPPVLGVSL